MPSLFEQNGGSPQKQPKYVPIFMDRSFTGLFTQRNVLHDPADVVTAKYYGGRPDALWQGKNIELTNRLTLQRRPGLNAFSSALYSSSPNRFFSFPLSNGTIEVIVDTGSTGNLSGTAISSPSAGIATLTGTFPFGGSNAYVGMKITLTGATNTPNNGTFVVTASTTTTISYSNAQAVAETTAITASSAGAIYIDNQDGTKTFLLGKGAGAGQAYFVAVAGILYIGDGVDVTKYVPGNPNTKTNTLDVVWNWGITAPALPPSVAITESAASAVSWVASTVFSTMGLIVDGHGNAEFLISVNSSGTNTTQFGTTGSGEPNWNQTPGGTTTDGFVTWTNWGPVPQWASHTLYNNASLTGGPGTLTNPSQIYDPTSNTVQLNIAASNAQATSGGTKPPFKAIQGATLHDPPGGNTPPNVKWFTMSPPPSKWKPSHAYTTFSGVDTANTAIIEPTALPAGTNQTVYMQICTTGGTSASSGTQPPFPALGVSNQITTDGDLYWLSLGSATRANTTAYVAFADPSTVFSVIVVGGRLYVCTASGISTGSAPSFSGTSYGDTVGDGSVTWTDVGPSMSWAANTSWYLPISGFAPPSASQSHGGASVVDSNGNLQTVIVSGKSGTTAPSWNTTKGGTTPSDGAITWYNEGVATTQSLAWKTGYVYAYSFKARALDDFYSTVNPITGLLPTPPGLNNPLPPPTGSQTEAVSTASPIFTITGANTGAINTISGMGSTDPQVDTIIIWRSGDGTGSGKMFELTEIPAPKPIGGNAQPWSFQDFLPDIPTTVGGVLYPGLNTLIPAPINLVNNPPDSTFLPMVYNYERIWGADGEAAPFSGGPDTAVGNPNEAFAPVNNIPFLSPVIRLVKTPQGIVTFLSDSVEVIGGGPQTASFFSITWAPGIGLKSFNALDVLGGEIYFFSSDNQLRIMTPGLNIQNAGFAIGDQLANLPSSGVSDTTWNAGNVYVASYQNGIDNCLMLCDGSTGWYRLNPRQAGAQPNTEPVWSPFAVITNGCKAVQSIEISPGQKRLLVGATTGGKQVLKRDLTVFTDNGTAYDAYFVMGSITLAHPGQIAVLKFVEFDFSGVSYLPTISYLLNEISGPFVSFVQNPVFDPPSLYGTTITPGTYSPNRYYFLGNGSLARCRHMQLKVDLGTTSNGDEMFNATIFGRILVET